ncbi:MAG TPA: hypothetical protein VGR64_08610 [Terracidiphilus sp.]|nr:hypothetical protein [Terracidiphilus sp.]
MRRILLLGLFALLTLSAAQNARAQRRGGARGSFAVGAHFSPARVAPQARFNNRTAIRPAYRRFDRDGDGDRDRFRGGRRRGVGYGYMPYGAGYGYVANDLGYDYAGYDSGYLYPADDEGSVYGYGSQQPVIVVQQPAPVFEQAPAPQVQKPPAKAEIEEYKWPAKSKTAQPAAAANDAETAQTDFGIVLKNGSVLTAETVFATDDGLHYVDPDGRHMLVAVSAVDRAATLKLNRERKLSLYLPAPE